MSIVGNITPKEISVGTPKFLQINKSDNLKLLNKINIGQIQQSNNLYKLIFNTKADKMHPKIIPKIIPKSFTHAGLEIPTVLSLKNPH